MKLFPYSVALVLVAIGLAAANGLRQPTPAVDSTVRASPMPAAAAQIARKPKVVIAVRLDPDVTRAMFLGDRWVSPPSYVFAQPGSDYVALAKAQYIDELGERMDLDGAWTATNPAMVGLTRYENGQVMVVVRRTGESELRVDTSRGSRNMHVRARQVNGGMQVEFNQ
jgi:hypothetical protein